MSLGYFCYKSLLLGSLKSKFVSYLKRNKAGSTSLLLREIFEKEYNIIVGYGSYGGCFNPSNVPSGVCFGNYCSIANGVKIFRANHPLNMFTTHPMFYNPIMGYVDRDKLYRPTLNIGNDVWIGANAIILPSVNTIGNGAVIDAGAIMTKDVAPYTIVCGNPAKLVKKRFNDRQIEYLEQSRWWEKSMDELVLLQNELVKKLDAVCNEDCFKTID